MTPDAISAVLGPGGLLAQASESYEHRPQQVQMAHLVKRALEEKRYAIVEAGTGTGKTLGYLLPAVLSGRKVVISTATKTLQDQIVHKDIPLLREVASVDFRATVLKGRGNYLCLQKLDRIEDDPSRLLSSRQDAKALPKIVEWARKTKEGDRAELDLPDNLSVWKDLSATSETCLGQKCERFEECFVTKIRRKAAESDLIIVNHHLFFADLALRSGKHGAEVLPKYDAVIFDEAHALEDVATEFFGVGVSGYRLQDLLSDTERAFEEDDRRLGMVAPLMSKVQILSDELFRELEGMLPSRSEQSVRITEAMGQRLQGAADDLASVLKAMNGHLGDATEPEVQAVGRRAAEIAHDLQFLVQASDPSFVYWAEARARTKFLRAAPIDVAEMLRERLYSQTETVVFTSATLATQGRFDFVKQRLGLQDPDSREELYAVDQLRVESPFDYREQSALYTPLHLPEPTAPDFVHAVAEEIHALTRITGGRAFALFTSLRNMTEAHRLLKDRLPFRVLLQGERPKQVLINEFREKPSVLFAAHSFWEGVDIAGDALSLVIIDKLPFASPGDPVVSARIDLLKSRGQEPFGAYQVPVAAIALRQGFGRLIRTQRDRGVVAILDRRISTKGYGRAFIESLPPAPRFAGLEKVQRWWTAVHRE